MLRHHKTLEDDYTAAEFAKLLKRKQPHYPISEHYNGSDYSKAWYNSQKQHILGWLKQYEGPGAYQRKSRGLTAKHFYNHFACAQGLLWLAEALGETPEIVEQASQAARVKHHPSAQCAAIRAIIPWTRILELSRR